MRHSIKLLSLSLLVCTLFLSETAAAQTVTAVHSPSTLSGRLDAAMATAGRSDAWVVYSFEKEMCERCLSGQIRWDSEWERTIEDVIRGREPSGKSVHDTVRETLQSLDDDAPGPDRMVRKDMAVMMRFEKGTLTRILHANMTTPFRFGDLPVYWLGAQEPTEILSLVGHDEWRRWDEEVRKGWTWVVGALDLVASLPWLDRAFSIEQSVEGQRAIAFAMGNLDTAASARTLERIALSDADMEVRKAAIFAIGNNDTRVARDILLTLIDTMGRASSS